MSQTIIIKRSSSTALSDGVSTLNFGILAVTNIGGVSRFYVGDSTNTAKEIAGDAYAKLNSPAFTGSPTAPTKTAGDNSTNIATTSYVKTAIDAAVQGLDVKDSVTTATVAALPAVTYDNGTAGVGATLTADANGAISAQDGITLVDGDRLLVKNQVDASENGIYTVTEAGDAGTAFILTRVADFDDVASIVKGSFTFSESGTVNADAGWTLTTDGTITVGTTDLVFAQFSGAGQVVAGDGLAKVGNVLSVNVDDVAIEINSDTLRLKDGGVADTKLATIATANKVSGSAVQLKAGSALEDSTGLNIVVDASSIVNNSGTLEVGTIDAGTF